MGKSLLLLLALLCTFIFSTQMASAHVLKTDGTIGAVLHILPDDDPEVNTRTIYELSFTDTNGKFNLRNCDCKSELLNADSVVSRSNLDDSSTLLSSNDILFPRPGIYTLRITGQPINNATFARFTLDYDVRVGTKTELKANNNFPPLLALGIAMAIGLVLIGASKTGKP